MQSFSKDIDEKIKDVRSLLLVEHRMPKFEVREISFTDYNFCSEFTNVFKGKVQSNSIREKKTCIRIFS